MTHQEQLTAPTRGHGDMRDVTVDVAAVVERAAVRTGIAHVFVVGSTAALGTVEFEPGLRRDVPEALDRLLPPGRGYHHEQAWHDGNGHSHLQATLLGPSLTVPVRDGAMALGAWQQVFLLECDVRPRSREIVVTVLGD